MNSARRTVDLDLSWGEKKPMNEHFEDSNNDCYTSEWPIEPPLPGAQVLSQSVMAFDVWPSKDGATRWSYDVSVNQEGSQLELKIWRWKGTTPAGFRFRVVLDNMEDRLNRMEQHMQRLEAENTRLRDTSQRHVDILFQNQNMQTWECNLHGMTIQDGSAERKLEESWQNINTAVQQFKQDMMFKVIYGAGNHIARGPDREGPIHPPMKSLVLGWFGRKDLRYTFLPGSAGVIHKISYRRVNSAQSQAQ